MKLLKLRSFKALRLPRLQFFTNSCRFFFSLVCAGFPRQMLPFISLLQSYVPLVFRLCPLSSRYLTVSFVAAYLPFACFSFRPGVFCISLSLLFIFHLLVHDFVRAGMWVERPWRFSVLHFIFQNAISRTVQPRRSFNLGW